MTRVLLALVSAALLAGCAGDPEVPAAVSSEQACDQAEQVTDTYRDALGDASRPEDAKAIILGAASGLRDINAAPPLSERIDDLADALSSLLAAVEAGAPPAELQPKAAGVGTSTTALARACGRTPGTS